MMRPVITKFFADYILDHLGIVYSDANYYQLENRIIDSSKSLGFDSIDAFYEAAQRHMSRDMQAAILDAATNNETLFFRDEQVFKAIEQIVAAGSFFPNKRLSIWSAACSYGQEPYSIAILLDRLQRTDFHILATDVCGKVLKKAETGTFNKLQVKRGLSESLLDSYFTKIPSQNGEDEWRIVPRLRERITFKQHNLLHDPTALGTFDIILCRNILIYQKIEAKIEIVKRLHARLAPGGLFVLGAAESLFGISDSFEMIKAERATLYRSKNLSHQQAIAS